MRIHSIEISGLSDLPSCSLQNISPEGMLFKSATPETTALADAMDVWFASFDEVALVDLLVRWGWALEEEIEILGDAHVEEVSIFDGTLAGLWVEERDVHITLNLELDAQAIQVLRTLCPQPEVHIALMESPFVQSTLHLRFSNDFTVISLGHTGMQIGHWRMPVEKPSWFGHFMLLFQQRFFRNTPMFLVEQLALDTMLSMQDYERYSAFQAACSEWGSLRVVRMQDREPLLFLDGLPTRRWGMEMEGILRVLATWHLVVADVVWSDRIMRPFPDDRQVWGIDPESNLDGRDLGGRAQAILSFPR